jgi:cytoskeleton protein RodZ
MSQASSNSTNGTSGPSNWENQTDLPVGEILRRTREYYNQSLEYVESILRIRAAQLQALEEGKIDQLPGRAYAIGFVRTYSEYLGLDGEKMVTLFKAQSGNQGRPRPDRNYPVPASESKGPNSFVVVTSLLGVALLVIAIYTFSSAPDNRPMGKLDIPQVPEDMRAESLASEKPAQLAEVPPPVIGPLPAGVTPQEAAAQALAQKKQAEALANGTEDSATTAAQADADPALAAASADANADAAPVATNALSIGGDTATSPLKVNIVETSWVEIRDGQGNAVLSRVLKPGDSFVVPANVPGLVMDTGNIGGVEFVLNGKTLAPMGVSGDVRRRISLALENFIDKPLATEATTSQPNDNKVPATSVNPAPAEIKTPAADQSGAMTTGALTPTPLPTPLNASENAANNAASLNPAAGADNNVVRKAAPQVDPNAAFGSGAGSYTGRVVSGTNANIVNQAAPASRIAPAAME